MRVALCLYGFYNNRSDQNAGDKGYKYIQDKIYNECKKHGAKLDVFFHCWELDLESKLLDQYKPKVHQFENPHGFNEIVIKNGINEEKINEGFDRKNTIYEQCKVSSSLSFFYSRTRALEFAIKYSNDGEFEYDCVIAARFDLGQRSGIHKGYNVSLMNFDLSLDMNNIYSAMWKQLNAGLADQWFFSNQENMKKLAKMYELSIKDYFQLGSKYEIAITRGWVDSNSDDQFSNEVLKKEKSKNLVKYPRWQMINNHILHKWHFINVGLYSKSKYI
jgi:hypothetical protein